METINKYKKNNQFSAYIFINTMVNHEAVRSSNLDQIRQLLVANGVDYMSVPNAFGWGEMMIVLFNPKLIVSKTRVESKDEIEVFNLPIKFKGD